MVGTACDLLKDRLGDVIMRWQEFTAGSPWTALPRADWIDHVPDLVERLIDSTCGATVDREARTATVQAALNHGQIRSSCPVCDEPSIFTEYYFLRRALWETLMQHHDRTDATTAMLRLDIAMSVATMASLRGLHRDVLQANGKWAHAVDDLVTEWERQLPNGPQAA